MNKERDIELQLGRIEKALDNARKYLEKGENVEGSSWLHFDDWKGNSGHPDWVRNHMIPSMKRLRARKEKVLRYLESKSKERRIATRRKGS